MNGIRGRNKIQELLTPEFFDKIAQKVIHGERISRDEGILLFEKAELAFLGMLADFIRTSKNGDKTYFIRNFHIEPTNICVNKCRFCSYSHHFSPQKWELSPEEILEELTVQYCRPNYWHKVLLRMTEEGINTFVEVGPGNVLTQMVRWVNRTARVITAEEILRNAECGMPNAE